MKKLLVLLSVGALMLGMAACGRGEADEDQNPPQNQETSQPQNTPDSVTPDDADAETPDAAGGHDYSLGWTDEMNAIKSAVTEELGEDYFPNAPLDPELLESLIGVTSDTYEDYFAEVPMISANVDTLIVVKAKEEQADEVEKVLNDYRDAKVGETMQYPQNIGKIQASKVERIGNYVVFVQLGGDIGDILDQGDEAVILYCQEVNDKVIEIIREAVK